MGPPLRDTTVQLSSRQTSQQCTSEYFLNEIGKPWLTFGCDSQVAPAYDGSPDGEEDLCPKGSTQECLSDEVTVDVVEMLCSPGVEAARLCTVYAEPVS